MSCGVRVELREAQRLRRVVASARCLKQGRVVASLSTSAELSRSTKGDASSAHCEAGVLSCQAIGEPPTGVGILGDADLQDKVREMMGVDMADLLSSARSVQSSGKKVSRSTTTTETFSGDEARQKLAEMGIDVESLRPQAGDPNSTRTALKQTDRPWLGWILLVSILGGMGALGWLLNS